MLPVADIQRRVAGVVSSSPASPIIADATSASFQLQFRSLLARCRRLQIREQVADLLFAQFRE